MSNGANGEDKMSNRLNRNLADVYYEAKQRLQAVEEEVATLREEILETKQKRIVGILAIVTVKPQERSTLVADKVRKMLTAAQIANATETKSIQIVKAEALAAPTARKASSADLFGSAKSIRAS